MAGNFFRSLRRTTRTVDNVNQIDPLITAMRNASSFDPSLNRMLMNGSFSLNTTTKRIRMNDAIDMNRADTLLRRGELRRFSTEINNPSTPSSSAEAGFRASIANTTPDLKVRQMDDAIVNARRGHSDLDKTPLPNQSVDDFTNSLTPGARRKLDGVFQKMKALGGTTLIIGGVVVVFIIGVDMMANLMTATANRRGCFQISTTGSRGNVQTCRVISRTCWNPRDDTCTIEFPTGFPNRLNPSNFFPTNVTLVLSAAYQNPELASSIKLALGDDDSVEFDPAYVATIMNNITRFRIVAEFHLDNSVFIPNPCMDMTGAFPGTELHLCRACDPSLESTHPGFIDLSAEENDNTSFLCIPSSSILDTIVDIGVGNGVDLLSPFGRFSDSGLGEFILYTLLLVLLIIVAAVIFSLIRKKKE